MVYTVTFNPAIDYCAIINNLKIDDVNRTVSEQISAGGKGINVSIILNSLEIENTALGFIAGFTGNEIKKRVEEYGVKTDFVYIADQFSRINVKLQSNINGRISDETAINGEGPQISDKAINELMKKIEKIKKGDYIVLAGSVARNMKNDIYEMICEKIKGKGVKIVADATGKLLLNVLKHRPFLIKPNKRELEEIFDKKIHTNDEVVFYAKKLQEMGAENVLISMDKEGAILLTNNHKMLQLKALKGQVINSVGSGDSMVAAFLTGFIKYNDYEQALKLGIAAGSATAFSKGLATREEIMYQFSRIDERRER